MANDEIDRLVRVFVDAPLRAAGFTRRARVWNRQRASVTDVIEVQASRWNEPGNRSFAVNLGVFAPSVHRSCWQKEPPDVVRAEDCVVRRRLHAGSDEAGAGRDGEQWWVIHEAADVERVGGEVSGQLVAQALPFFDQAASLEDVVSLLETCTGPDARTPLARIYLAIVKAELGDSLAARRILSDLATTGPAAWRDRVAAVDDEIARIAARHADR